MPRKAPRRKKLLKSVRFGHKVRADHKNEKKGEDQNMRNRLKTSGDGLVGHFGNRATDLAWKNVRAALAAHRKSNGDLKPCDFVRLPHVERNGQAYPKDIRTVAFHIGHDLYTVHAAPLATDENAPTGEYCTFVFNISARTYLGSIAQARSNALVAAETERCFMKRTRDRVVYNPHAPAYAKTQAVRLIDQAHNALWGHQLVNDLISNAASVLAEYHPGILKNQPQGWRRDLVDPTFHAKMP